MKTLEQKLEIVREIQNKYPYTILTGSLALILQGVKVIERDYDIDILTSEIIYLESDIELDEEIITSTGNQDDLGTFEPTMYKGVKVEQRIIDNLEFYNNIIKDGDNYRVSPIDRIYIWKMKYAERGNQKHSMDLYTAMGLTYTDSSNVILPSLHGHYNEGKGEFDNNIPF